MTVKHNPRWHVVALSAGAILATGIATTGAAQGRDDAHTKTPIKHVIVIFPENESFDHYFGTYPFAETIPASRASRRAKIRRR